MSEEPRPDRASLGPDESPPGSAAPPPEVASDGIGEADPQSASNDERVERFAPPPRSRVLLGRVALALVAIVAAAAAFVWWQSRQADRTAAADAAALSMALDVFRDELNRAETRASELAGELRAALDAERRDRQSLAARLEPLPGRLGELDRRIGTLQGAPVEARSDWFRAQAEYYLTVASTELALTGRWQTAITALDLADGLLADLADSTLAPVREAIAAERLALTSVRLPDVERLAFTLSELAARALDLPLREELPASYTPPPSDVDDEAPGLARLLATIKSALAGLVRVERRSTPVAPELAAAERRLARRQLELELTVARVAAVDGRAPPFRDALERARVILQRDFDGEAADVERALALVDELVAVDVDPPRPTLGRALNLLRGIAAGAP